MLANLSDQPSRPAASDPTLWGEVDIWDLPVSIAAPTRPVAQSANKINTLKMMPELLLIAPPPHLEALPAGCSPIQVLLAEELKLPRLQTAERLLNQIQTALALLCWLPAVREAIA